METLPLLNPGDAWELFDTDDLRRWLVVFREQRKEERLALVEASRRYRRTRDTIHALRTELARRGEALTAKEN